MYLTRTMQGGAFLVGLIFLSAWGCDTCAYCVGMLTGKTISLGKELTLDNREILVLEF